MNGSVSSPWPYSNRPGHAVLAVTATMDAVACRGGVYPGWLVGSHIQGRTRTGIMRARTSIMRPGQYNEAQNNNNNLGPFRLKEAISWKGAKYGQFYTFQYFSMLLSKKGS